MLYSIQRLLQVVLERPTASVLQSSSLRTATTAGIVSGRKNSGIKLLLGGVCTWRAVATTAETTQARLLLPISVSFLPRKQQKLSKFSSSSLLFHQKNMMQQQQPSAVVAVASNDSVSIRQASTSSTRTDAQPQGVITMPQLPLQYMKTAGITDDHNDPVVDSWDDCLKELGTIAMEEELQRQKDIESNRIIHSKLIQIRSIIGTQRANDLLQDVIILIHNNNNLRTSSSTSAGANNEVGENHDDGGGGGDWGSDTTGITIMNKNNNHSQPNRVLSRITGTGTTSESRRVMEELIRLLAYQHFLTKGTMMMPMDIPFNASSTTNASSQQQEQQQHLITVTDEDYLIGACIGLCQDLVEYGLGRATVRDIHSIQSAKLVVQDIYEYMLTQFDFRNGYIRRKYDGIKYCLKDLETLLYEMAITGGSSTSGTGSSTGALGGDDVEPNQAMQVLSGTVNNSNSTTKSNMNTNNNNNNNKHTNKKPRTIGADTDNNPVSSSLSSLSLQLSTSPRISDPIQLEQLAQRMAHRDELREILIKKCRDGQKTAKHCIFAIHRLSSSSSSSFSSSSSSSSAHTSKLQGDINKLLEECKHIICTELVPIIEQDPSLRLSGSFTSVIEEYIEAKLFATWLYGTATTITTDTTTTTTSTNETISTDTNTFIVDATTTTTTTSNDDEENNIQNNIVVSYAANTGTNTNSTPPTMTTDNTKPKLGRILNLHDIDLPFPIQPDEYLGGLCDVTGEIGRYAVSCGTARDGISVQKCLQTNTQIATALQLYFVQYRVGTNVYKKMDSVKRSVTKLQRMLYEMSLSDATGCGRNIQSSIVGTMEDSITDEPLGNSITS